MAEKNNLYRDRRTKDKRMHRVAVINYKDGTTETIEPIFSILRHKSNILFKYQEKDDKIKIIKAEGIKGIVIQGEVWIVSEDEISPPEQPKDQPPEQPKDQPKKQPPEQPKENA